MMMRTVVDRERAGDKQCKSDGKVHADVGFENYLVSTATNMANSAVAELKELVEKRRDLKVDSVVLGCSSWC